MSDYDVIIVGLGPTGAVAANILGAAGIRTAVLERESRIYHLPRAVHFDAETMRTFQRLDLADTILPITERTWGMEFVNGNGTRLFGTARRGEQASEGPFGWARGYMFYQPHLDRILRDGVARYNTVDVHLEHDVIGLDVQADRAVVTVKDRTVDTSCEMVGRYLLACDGASSPIRHLLDIGLESLGFDQRWLVVDTMLRRAVELPLSSQQICCTGRPTTFVRSAGDHRRWEFQLQPGEDPDEMRQAGRVWELLSPWVTAEDTELIRHVVYEFHGLVANRWNKGPVFLLGDAAHQMPPFQGQGMCSGIRDALNLCWKLEGVLDGRWDDAALDSYECERKPHSVALVDSSVRVGRLIDWIARTAEAGIDFESPQAIVERDNAVRRIVIPPLDEGLVEPKWGENSPVGRLLPQPLVTGGDATHRFDDNMGLGFALVVPVDREELVTPSARSILDRIGGRWVTVPSNVSDDALPSLLREHPAIFVRPDRYIYGVASDCNGVDALAGVLVEQLRRD